MEESSSGEAAARAFLEARSATARGARDRHLRGRGISSESPEYEEAARAWDALPLLLDPEVRDLAHRAASGALGRPISSSDHFPLMLWYGGRSDTRGGHRFKGTIQNFVDLVLIGRAGEVAEKGRGWVVEPTTNVDGHRANASTKAMHALFLDADAGGSWTDLLAQVRAVGLGAIFYQSGGHGPGTPKWRVIFPLDAPFDTSSPERAMAWRSAYATARTAFGALAGLRGGGFDATVDVPAIPWFVTERRRAEDPLREVLLVPGRRLDIHRLLALLPEPPPDVPEPRVAAPRADAEEVALDDAALEKVVSALAGAMAPILRDRRDLYLALPGTLLARGMAPDDVRTVIEEVSTRCPGDPRYSAQEVASRHREHLHCAETTIAKHEAGDPHTQVGVLHERWPEVVRALDGVLPDPETRRGEMYLADIDAKRAARAASAAAIEEDPRLDPALSPAAPALPPIEEHIDLGRLRRDLRALSRRKLRAPEFSKKVEGVVLGALLDGEDLVPYLEPGKPLEIEGLPTTSDWAIFTAMRQVAWKLPEGTPFEVVEEFSRLSLWKMSAEGEKTGGDSLASLKKAARKAFARSIGRRIEKTEKDAKTESERRVRSHERHFSNTPARSWARR